MRLGRAARKRRTGSIRSPKVVRLSAKALDARVAQALRLRECLQPF
jgi:hypothetical protein